VAKTPLGHLLRTAHPAALTLARTRPEATTRFVHVRDDGDATALGPLLCAVKPWCEARPEGPTRWLHHARRNVFGTPWELDTRGAILLLEDRGLKPYQLDRMLLHLRRPENSRACAHRVGEFPSPNRPREARWGAGHLEPARIR